MQQSMKIPGLQDHIRQVMKQMVKKGRKMVTKGVPRLQPLGAVALKMSLMKSIKGGIDKSAMAK